MKTYRLKKDTEWDIARYKKAIENHREIDAFLGIDPEYRIGHRDSYYQDITDTHILIEYSLYPIYVEGDFDIPDRIFDILKELAFSQDIIHLYQVISFIKKQEDYLNSLVTKEGKFNVFEIKNRMKDVMWEHCAIFRTGEGLAKAVKELEELYKQSLDVKVSNKELFGNPELEEAYRVPKMLKLALCIAKGALDRTESRGAHFREDYPKRDDLNWLKRTLANWKEGDTMPTLSYEPLDIMKMEMPPAFRGYGAKGNIIEHPDSAVRQKEVDEIREKMQAEGKGRYEIQEALMHYELQPKYKAPNERAGIGYE